LELLGLERAGQRSARRSADHSSNARDRDQRTERATRDGERLLRHRLQHAAKRLTDRALDEPPHRSAGSLDEAAKKLLEFLFALYHHQFGGELVQFGFVERSLAESSAGELVLFMLFKGKFTGFMTAFELRTIQVVHGCLSFPLVSKRAPR